MSQPEKKTSSPLTKKFEVFLDNEDSKLPAIADMFTESMWEVDHEIG